MGDPCLCLERCRATPGFRPGADGPFDFAQRRLMVRPYMSNQKMCLNSQNRQPESNMAAGRGRTHASDSCAHATHKARARYLPRPEERPRSG